MVAPAPLDYNAWLAKEQWSVSEASKLLCGRNPDAKIPGTQIFNRSVRVIDLIDSAFGAAQAGNIRIVRNALLPIHLLVEPASFVRWASAQGHEIPPAFERLLVSPELTEGRTESARDRVEIIARTLKIVDPQLTVEELAMHRAMRQLVNEREASPHLVLQWVREAFPG